jgi:hypothetical protein
LSRCPIVTTVHFSRRTNREPEEDSPTSTLIGIQRRISEAGGQDNGQAGGKVGRKASGKSCETWLSKKCFGIDYQTEKGWPTHESIEAVKSKYIIGSHL